MTTRISMVSFVGFAILALLILLNQAATAEDETTSPLTEAIRHDERVRRATPHPYHVTGEEIPGPLTHRDLLVMRASYEGEAAFLEDLLAHLDSDDETLKLGCLRIIGKLDLEDESLEITHRIRETARLDDSIQCQSYAISLLGSLNDPNDVPFFLSLICHEDERLHYAAAICLLHEADHLTDENVALLIGHLDEERTYSVPVTMDMYDSRPMAVDVARILGKTGPRAEAALPKLRELFKDKSWKGSPSEYAGAALRISPDQKWAASCLVKMLHFHRSDRARSEAVRLLANIHGKHFSCLPHLEHALRYDRDDYVRANALRVLTVSYETTSEVENLIAESLSLGNSEDIVDAALHEVHIMEAPTDAMINEVKEYLRRYFSEGSPFEKYGYQTDRIAVQTLLKHESPEQAAAFFTSQLAAPSPITERAEEALLAVFDRDIPNREELNTAFQQEYERVDLRVKNQMMSILERIEVGNEISAQALE
jgi:HEAT repeat protein